MVMSRLALLATLLCAYMLWPTACARRRASARLRLAEPDRYQIRRNFVTGSFHYKNLTRVTEPEPVRRLRLIVSLIDAASSTGFIEVYRVKVRWVQPELWWDNLRGADSRYFELRCELEDEKVGVPHTFLKLNMDASINGYDENFLVRQPFPLVLRCRMRSCNGLGLHSRWTWTNAVRLYKLYGVHAGWRAHTRMQQYGAESAGKLQLRPPPVATYMGRNTAKEAEPEHENAAPAEVVVDEEPSGPLDQAEADGYGREPTSAGHGQQERQQQVVQQPNVVQPVVQQKLEHPIVQQNVKQPPVIQQQPIAQQVVQQLPVAQQRPVSQQNVEQPVAQQQNVEQQSVAQPNVEQLAAPQNVEQSVIQQNVKQSLAQQIVKQPLIQPNVKQPVVQQIVKQPVAQQLAQQQISKQPVVQQVEQPVGQQNVEQQELDVQYVVQQPVAQQFFQQQEQIQYVAQQGVQQQPVAQQQVAEQSDEDDSEEQTMTTTASSTTITVFAGYGTRTTIGTRTTLIPYHPTDETPYPTLIPLVQVATARTPAPRAHRRFPNWELLNRRNVADGKPMSARYRSLRPAIEFSRL